MTDDFTSKSKRRRLLPKAGLAARTSVVLSTVLQDTEPLVEAATPEFLVKQYSFD